MIRESWTERGRRTAGWTAAALGAVLGLAAGGAALAAPHAGAKPSITSPSITGPSITGMWILKADDYGRDERPSLTPQAEAAALAARKATEEQGKVLSEHALKCLPIGMPRFMMNEFALEILESPGRVTMISENSPLARSIYLGRTSHTADAEPGWNGHSIGHWEGAVLVVDTTLLNDRISHVPRSQTPSGATHIVERLSLAPGGKMLADEMTFTDPALLTKPYTVTTHYERLPADAELWEYACEVDAAGWSERYANDPAAKIGDRK
ncbi:MAG: hypothetical protein JF588_04030 [Caulobacterales bacterium]|nr:hypothetical protein [Caulobacterales bacterium]